MLKQLTLKPKQLLDERELFFRRNGLSYDIYWIFNS